ncbi:amidohydrolase family protein [Glaciimonas sp. PAMC28666]|uniref:amidohydrolase family protein n=1 Tax=Glaciimonas sp. PAMC28666 TaxID=2807626 RepID=UPI001963F602|nr:amidohydrolase family protein [Glaciimonas sp. PAMC28666]QRX81741.1 amidohydrolase [Glaciimonas sp. PAMC28666]
MKIICIEEHTVDFAIAKASHQAQEMEAGYMSDWGSRVKDEPADFNDNRPHLVAPEISLKLATDVGAGRIAEMDKHGIDMQVLSYSTLPQLAPASQAIALTRAANDRLAEAVLANPSRFGGFATLPWQDPQAAAAELERSVRELGFKGTLLSGRPGLTFLDDPRYEPVLAKLNALKVPIYVHPGFPLTQVREPYYGGLDKEVSARLSLFGWGWHNEAGIQVIRMILSGKFDKYPHLQVISGHWGEMVPFYLQRMDDTIPQEATRLSRTITETYKQHVYVTPSGMLNLPHFEFIHKVMGADRIIYSVDYPYLTHTGARAFLENLPISQDDKEKIAHRNAEALFRM